jgi:thiamine biosynthesis protein ThiS
MITVNGVKKDISLPITLSAFLAQEGYQTARIAVELNETIIPKAQYDNITLTEADVLEVVSFVGGG